MLTSHANQPGQRYWALVEPEWMRLNASWYEEPAEFIRQFQATPMKAGYLYSAHWCQSEVCNGGFYQFFYNTTGILAPEALSAFEVIGLQEWRDILRRAMSFFGEAYPRERSLRLEILPEPNGRKREDYDPFYALDEQFYDWLHGEDDRWERAADSFADCA